MSDFTNQQRTGMSAAHSNPSTRYDNPLLDKAGSVTPTFDAALCAQSKQTRRESFMIKRQAPQLVPRPGKSIAADVDRAHFNKEWELERKDALRDAKQARREQFHALRALDRAENDTNRIAPTGDQTERKALQHQQHKVERVTEESNRAFGHFKHRASPYLR